ncbi:helix-turn-helix domain-containing protein [Sedimentibacter sp.]|uniref:TetR/AcrR family transcriptional regulator n=1 Tax=Sedimentibacter sp. TaxID=1960295 RepID=UPI0028AE6FED|nr:helix-turn-helix domain-containing protein [Sedimentibacter sp.]
MYERFHELDMEKQQRILDTSLEEFSENGYEIANTNEIVKRANIGKGMLFRYFDSKAGLFFYLADYCFDRIEKELFDRLDLNDRDIFSRYRQLEQLKASMLKKNSTVYSFAAVALNTQNKELIDGMHEKKQRFIQSGNRIFDNLDTSRFRDETSVDRVVKIIAWTVSGFERELLPKAEELIKASDAQDKLFREFDAYLETLEHNFYK